MTTIAATVRRSSAIDVTAVMAMSEATDRVQEAIQSIHGAEVTQCSEYHERARYVIWADRGDRDD